MAWNYALYVTSCLPVLNLFFFDLLTLQILIVSFVWSVVCSVQRTAFKLNLLKCLQHLLWYSNICGVIFLDLSLCQSALCVLRLYIIPFIIEYYLTAVHVVGQLQSQCCSHFPHERMATPLITFFFVDVQHTCYFYLTSWYCILLETMAVCIANCDPWKTSICIVHWNCTLPL